MERQIVVRGLVLHEGKLLCVQNKHEGEPAYWCLPGGHVEPGEDITTALKREIVEELGVEPVIGQLLYFLQFPHRGFERLEFIFSVTNAGDYQNIDLTKTSHGEVEIGKVDFIDTNTDNLFPEILRTDDVAARIASGHVKLI